MSYTVERMLMNSCDPSCSSPNYKKIWFRNPTRHPRTGKKLRIGGKRWKRLVRRYGIPPATNKQRRVIYIGYWLSNDNISDLVQKWKQAQITHVILTFITQIDIMKPLSDAYSMTLAYQSLTPENQKLLTDNFIIGVSYGGGAAMPAPYSKTFESGAYYENNPEKLAQDLVKLCGNLNLYYDLDIEHLDDKFDESAEFIGRICVELKRLQPNCEISHAPQLPYFTPGYGNIYQTIYNNYKDSFDFFNLQYYNNGPSDTYEQIFIKSDPLYFANTSVLELIQSGIDSSYLVMGKPVNLNEGSAGGYVPLIPNLVDIIKEAFDDSRLIQWSISGGVMIWFYNTQAGTTTDNQNLLSYMQEVAYL
jgi:hypothetical protein